MKPSSHGSYFIGLAGPSGSGKTFMSRFITDQFGSDRVVVVALDSYYRDLSAYAMAEREKVNFDSPDALEHELLTEHLIALSKGQSIDKPVYDFSTHTRSKITEKVFPKELIVLEGLFTFYWNEIRELLQTKVYIDADMRTGLERRMTRDTHERGRTAESVAEQYAQTVAPMCEKYILPTRAHADVVISATASPEESLRTIKENLQIKGCKRE